MDFALTHLKGLPTEPGTTHVRLNYEDCRRGAFGVESEATVTIRDGHTLLRTVIRGEVQRPRMGMGNIWRYRRAI